MGSAAGVLRFAQSGKAVIPSRGWDDEWVADCGDELFARLRFLRRLGVSNSFELFGIQPMFSSGERSIGASLAVASQSPIKSASGSLAPGVHGKVVA